MLKRIYTFTSYNCKSVKRSVESIRDLCSFSDIIALQETWLIPAEIQYLSSIDSNFSYAGTSAVDTTSGMLRGRPYGGVALLWKTSVFQNVSVLPCDNPRVCAIKIITSDRPIVVMSVYMPTDARDNLPEFTDGLGTVSAIVEEYGVESVYVMGDFNAHPGELFFNELLSFCNDQNWCCVDIDKIGNLSSAYSFISEAHGCTRWLDHCIVTQSAKQSVSNVYIKYDVSWSDHFPLVLECNLNLLTPKIHCQNREQSKTVWGDRNNDQIVLFNIECQKRLKLIDFPLEFRKCANFYCNDPNHKHTIDKLYGDIVSALSEAAIVSGDTSKRKHNKPVAGWNMYVREAHGVARLKFQTWLLYGKPTSGRLYDEMCESKRIFKSKLKWCQNHQNQLKLDLLASKHAKNDFRAFWKDTNKLLGRPGLPVSIGGESDPKDIANLFKDIFIVKSSLGPAQLMHSDELPSGKVGTRFTTKEVAEAIKSISRGKSPGHDGLSIEHLQYAGPHISRVLAVFYSVCISHSYLPAALMKTIVVPVVKNKTGDLADKKNYRPISLATIVAKVFDSMLNIQLDKYLNLHGNQFGFRPGLSTESAILSLKHTVKYYTTRKTAVFACFLDLSKAFDLVSYNILWRKLEDIKLPHELVHIFKYWYGNQVNHVRWAGNLSEPYRMECGVRQGGLSSPALFNLYVDALIVALSSERVGCHVDGVCVNNISYADDMVLLSASICGLRKLVNICESYAISHGLKYNVHKSEVMVFGAGGGNIPNVPPVKLDDAPLQRVHIFKYLGHVITTDLKDDADLERERRALSVRANMIARRFARCTREVKITLFKAYCTSFYTSGLWANFTQRSYNALRVQFNNAFRVLLGLPRCCSASGMFAEARTDCFYAIMRKRCASLVRRVRVSSNSILAMIAGRVDCPYVNHCCRAHVN